MAFGRAMESLPEQDGESRPFTLFDDDVWAYLANRLMLSPREIQVIRGVCQDRKEAEIAADLGLSSYTVHTYVDRVYRKLQVNSRVELVVFLAEHRVLFCQEPNSPLPPICCNRISGRCPLCE
jgi:DNA-binding NarL/FixJ family response regulator